MHKLPILNLGNLTTKFIIKLQSKRIGIHVLPKKLSKGGGLLSFVSLLWKVANGLAIGFYNSPMAY